MAQGSSRWPRRLQPEAKWRTSRAVLGPALLLALLSYARGPSAGAEQWFVPAPVEPTWAPPAAPSSAEWSPLVASYDSSPEEPPFDPFCSFSGYDNGFVIANHGLEDASDDDFPFLLRINYWMQVRHARFDSNGPNRDRNVFTLERIRLGLTGHLFTPDLQYSAIIDGNSDQSVQASFLDAFATYDLGHALFGWEELTMAIRGGNWKVPFSRSREESARSFQFSERMMANYFFDIGRSVGAGLYAENELFGAPIRFETAIFNGFNTGRDSTSPNEDLDQNFGWSSRASADLFSVFGNDGEPDLSWHESPALRIGGGLAATRIDEEGRSEFTRQRVVDSGERLADLLPNSVSRYDVLLATVDAHWKYRGLALIAEHHWRYFSGFDGAQVPQLLDQGVLVQGGYFVVPQRLELLLRWAEVVGDSGSLGLAEQGAQELGTGFAWYLQGHNAKFNADLSRVTGTTVNSARLNLVPGDEGWLMRTQFQFGF